MISISEVGWSYRSVPEPALSAFSFDVVPGEVVVLCGGSGSGKSSALRLINGLIPHFHEGDLSGEVTLAADVVADLSLEDLGRRTGTVQQQPRRQFFTDRVVQEIAFALENTGVPHPALGDQVRASLQAHRLEDLADRRLDQLSGGQQQSVACAAATAHRPAAVVLDEPTANLSTAAVTQVVHAVDRLRRAGCAVVIAEHRLEPFVDVADRFVVLGEGQVRAGWDQATFRGLDDDTLAGYGLRSRGSTSSALPPIAATGPSVHTLGEDAPAPEPAGPAVSADRTGLTVEGLRCVRAGRTVLQIDEAHFPAGAVTVVRGPNGAGKSSLGRVLSGLQRHDGDVRLNGRRLSRGQRLRQTAVVLQDPQRQLFTDRVDAELASATDLPRPAGSPDVLEDLGLSRFGDRHPLALSGGQQQRLVLATAVVQRRPVVVLDEPSSGVDRRHLASIAGQVRAMAAGGAVVVLITHDDDLAAAIGDAELRLAPVAARRDP